MSRRRARVALLALLFGVAVSGLALAASSERVDQEAGALLFTRAQVLFDRGDYAAVRDRLDLSLALHDAVPTRVLLGRALLGLGDCERALATLGAIRPEVLAIQPATERVVLEARVACAD